MRIFVTSRFVKFRHCKVELGFFCESVNIRLLSIIIHFKTVKNFFVHNLQHFKSNSLRAKKWNWFVYFNIETKIRDSMRLW
jgi:hypothetical protein